MIRPAALAALFAAIAVVPVSAQERGRPLGTWGTSFNMGTSAVGVTNEGGAYLGFFCGSRTAAAANPAIRGGPYATVTKPVQDTQTSVSRPTTMMVVTDRRRTEVPVTLTIRDGQIALDWRPSAVFPVERMRELVGRMRQAERLSVRASGIGERFPLAEAASALAEDPFGCR